MFDVVNSFREHLAGWPGRHAPIMPRLLPRSLAAGLLAVGIILIPTGGFTEQYKQPDTAPRIDTNQSYVESVLKRSELDLTDTDLVFGHVFAALPDRVKVYPTENYYYFRFVHNGLPYAGNLRLDASDRDKGRINFAYFPASTGWRQDDVDHFKIYGSEHGVAVEKIGALSYKVTAGGRSVVFELNDLSDVKPPEGLLNEDERFLGPVFDESGIQMFLVFNERLKLFHYILNETEPVPDELYKSRVSDRIVVGRRTGFAWYKEHYKDRKILIGVHSENITVNNYYDGPFDQLPDNFVKGDEMRDAMVAAGLANEKEIDRFGILPGEEERVLVKPYLAYEYLDDLEIFADCAKDRDLPRELYYECFVVEENRGEPDTAPDGDDGGETELDLEPEATASDQPASPDVPAASDQQVTPTQATPSNLAETAKPVTVPDETQALLSISTNQQLIETWRRNTAVDIDSIDTVFSLVLGGLPETVRVYPTENYFYFNFHHGGISWSGNMRLGVEDRDAGKMHFTYYPTYTIWKRDPIDNYKVFGAEDGVTVEKIAALKYRVTQGAMSVVFELNDLENVEPPSKALSPDETYIGPVFDESGITFFLVYNSKAKVFHYILDETKIVPDELYVSDISPRIVLGRRTGFAFYKDKNRDRKILIGVYGPNSNVNGWLDGPFDQLPDNFIKGDTLRDALIDFTPELDGRIDRYGAWEGGTSRYLIGPYLYYEDLEQLTIFEDCALSPEMTGIHYYKCFFTEETPR